MELAEASPLSIPGVEERARKKTKAPGGGVWRPELGDRTAAYGLRAVCGIRTAGPIGAFGYGEGVERNQKHADESRGSDPGVGASSPVWSRFLLAPNRGADGLAGAKGLRAGQGGGGCLGLGRARRRAGAGSS